MIAFAKDLGAFEGESKYDMLAVAVARVIGKTVKFFSPAYEADLVVSQFGDGRLMYESGKKNVFIFHDWKPNYDKYVSMPHEKAIFLGNFEHPVMEKSVTFASYPAPRPMARPYDSRFPILVTGEYYSGDEKWVAENVGEGNVRVACFDCMHERNESVKEAIAKEGREVEVVPFAPIWLLLDYRGSATRILHLGGYRGMLHAAAVSTGKCLSQTGDDSFDVPDIRKLCSVLLPYDR